MNKLDLDYQALLQDILDNGVKKQDRTGTGTLSVFGRIIRHDMKTGFPLLTTKRIKFDLVVSELIWFLQGRTDLRYLLEHNNHIWVGDAYKKYENALRFARKMQSSISNVDGSEWEAISKEEFIERIKTDNEFAKKWGELGPVYGKQWRRWNTNMISRRSSGTISEDGIVNNMTFIEDSPIQIDQIANLVHDLKTNPDSRRLMVNAWNPAEIDQMTLPPCHYGFQCYTRELSLKERFLIVRNKQNDVWKNYYDFEKFELDYDTGSIKIDSIPTRALSLKWNQRSVDTPLGLPFNIASYGLLLEILAKEVNMVPDELIGSLGDCHIYLNQIDGIKEQLTREPYKLSTLKFEKTDEFFKSLSDDLSLLNHLEISDFKIENYESHPTIKIPLSN